MTPENQTDEMLQNTAPEGPRTLTFPACALVILVGPSGSGKSTFARAHFKESQILASDVVRQMLTDDAASQNANEDVFAFLHEWIALRLKHRRFTVVDSTALKGMARDNLLAIAHKQHVPCYAIGLDVPYDECLRRDAARLGRQVGEKVVKKHYAQWEQVRRDIVKDKRFARADVLTPEEMERGVIIQTEKPATGGEQFDIIGDVHGCWPELCDLWDALGYGWDVKRNIALPPTGRVCVFVGDLADRGPDSPKVLRTVCDMVAAGVALFAPGNHDDKLFRMLRGNKVTRSHGLDVTEEQLNALPDDERAALTTDVLTYLASAPPYLILDNGNLVVAHAGIREDLIGDTSSGRVREFTLYGDVRGFEPVTNKPIRYDWAQDYAGAPLVVYGHTPQMDIRFVNNTINIDGGCVFGGKLVGLRYPEREIVSVPARAQYAEHESITPSGVAAVASTSGPEGEQ